MLQEMRIRNYSPNTITTYISLLAAMARHFNKSPDLISSDELKDYLFKKISQDQLSPSAINQIISAFRILQVDVLGNDWDPIKVKRPKTPKTLPVVFSKEEITAILASLKNRKHYCLVALTYVAGLRLNEVVNLKPADFPAPACRSVSAQVKAMKSLFKGTYNLPDSQKNSRVSDIHLSLLSKRKNSP